MKVVKRLVIEDWQITALNRDHFEVKWGDVVTTSEEVRDGKVMVFKNFWVPVPIEYFARETKPI